MVDYSPTENCYARVDFDREAMQLLSSDKGRLAVRCLLIEFSSLTKNIVVRDIAMSYWKDTYCRIMGIYCTEECVKQAYDLAYGYGCEFGWEVLG